MSKSSPYKYMVRFLPYNRLKKSISVCVQIYKNSSSVEVEDCSNIRDVYVNEFNEKHGGIKINDYPCLHVYSIKTFNEFDMFVSDLGEIYHMNGVIINSTVVDVLSGFPSVEYANACLSYVFDEEVALCDVLSMLDFTKEYWGDVPITSSQIFSQYENTNTEYLGYYLKARSKEIQTNLEDLTDLVTSVNKTMEVFRAKEVVKRTTSSLDQTPDSIRFQGMWMS